MVKLISILLVGTAAHARPPVVRDIEVTCAEDTEARGQVATAEGLTTKLERWPKHGDVTLDGSLQRLAEILGALHYLRNICGANEGQKWRDEMQSLVNAEAPSGDRRLRMIASFNRGYRGYQQSYRTCTPAAELVIRRYLEEGSKIAREMTARYAN